MANQTRDQKLEGLLSSAAREFALRGEFSDGTLELVMSGQDGQETTFTARARDDGTLAGYVSGPMGDMKWTAERVEKK